MLRVGDHRHAQVLVDHLPDPGVVVQEDADDRREHHEESGCPDHGARPDGLALRFAQKLALVDVAGDVVEDVRLVHEQQLRLQRLQLVADKDLVVEHIRAEQSEGEQDKRYERGRAEEDQEMLDQRPDERPALECQLQDPPRADRRQIREGLGARHDLGRPASDLDRVGPAPRTNPRRSTSLLNRQDRNRSVRGSSPIRLQALGIEPV